MEIKFIVRDIIIYLPLSLYMITLLPFFNKRIDFDIAYAISIGLFLFIIFMVNFSFAKVISRKKLRPSKELLNSLDKWSGWLLYDYYSKNKIIYVKSTIWVIIIINLLLLEKLIIFTITLLYLYVLKEIIKNSAIYIAKRRSINYLNSLSKDLK